MAFNQKYGTIIGIDPDADKSGVCIIDCQSRACEIYNLNFPETLEFLKQMHETRPKPFMAYIEAGWLNHGNWHIAPGKNGKFSPQAWAAAVGSGLGECNAVSKKLLECCDYYGIPAQPIKPLRKCWRGKDRKITHEELVKEMATYRVSFPYKRSNPETRDASLIALVKL